MSLLFANSGRSYRKSEAALTSAGCCYLCAVVNSLSEERARPPAKAERLLCESVWSRARKWKRITQELTSEPWGVYRRERRLLRTCSQRHRDKNKMCVLSGSANRKTCVYSAVIRSQPGLNSRCPNQCSRIGTLRRPRSFHVATCCSSTNHAEVIKVSVFQMGSIKHANPTIFSSNYNSITNRAEENTRKQRHCVFMTSVFYFF